MLQRVQPAPPLALVAAVVDAHADDEIDDRRERHQDHKTRLDPAVKYVAGDKQHPVPLPAKAQAQYKGKTTAKKIRKSNELNCMAFISRKRPPDPGGAAIKSLREVALNDAVV